jgi:hypothetical protein
LRISVAEATLRSAFASDVLEAVHGLEGHRAVVEAKRVGLGREGPDRTEDRRVGEDDDHFGRRTVSAGGIPEGESVTQLRDFS